METNEELKEKIVELQGEIGKLNTDLQASKQETDNYRRWYIEANNKYNALSKKLNALVVLMADMVNEEGKLPF